MTERRSIGECGIVGKTLGEHLRAMRKQCGYTNTETFSKALDEIAGYHASKETIYRIESGKQEPSISYVCAASIAMHGRILSFSMDSVLRASACEEWQIVEAEAEREAKEKRKRYEQRVREMMEREGLATYQDEFGDIYF